MSKRNRAARKRLRNKMSRGVAKYLDRNADKSGNGEGPHQEVSCMGHATRTASKAERLAQRDRQERQRGWDA